MTNWMKTNHKATNSRIKKNTLSFLSILLSLGAVLAEESIGLETSGQVSETLEFIDSSAEFIETCSLWLAESSVPNAGWGVFAGKNFAKGEKIGFAGIGIQVIDPYEIFDQEDILAEFGWDPVAVGGDYEGDSVFTMLPGIGMLVNFHPVLHNTMPTSLIEDPLVDRSHPSAGSYTSYHNCSFQSTREIKAGHEIFASVGDEWYSQHDLPIPIKKDYEKADRLLRDLLQFYNDNPQTVQDATMMDILYRLKNEILAEDKNIIGLLPDSIEDLMDFVDRGTAEAFLSIRSEDWLTQNGKCLDSIRPGKSTIDGAGRGAFATRKISQGSIVAPAPLIQVMNSTFLTLEDSVHDTNQQQLLLNYCFGHRSASFVLCPTTSVTLINHSYKAANVKIRWAKTTKNVNNRNTTSYHTAPKEYLSTDANFISDQNTKLTFDLVAIRDIEEGEEIFLDYGEEWEEAWSNHVAQWNPPEELLKYTLASFRNALNDPISPSQSDDLHSYLCNLEPFARDTSVESEDQIPMEDYHANPSTNRSSWSHEISEMYSENEYIWWWPCKVISASEDSGQTFRVDILKRTQDDDGQRPVIRKIQNIPRSAIRFVDKPYQSNQHLKNAFRHYIPIPDSIFPLHWRDDYVTADSLKLGFKDVGTENNESEDLIKNHRKTLEDAKCGMYVAPSTIPNAGNGLFLGVDIPAADFYVGPQASAIPIIDLVAERWDAYDYTWEASILSADWEGEGVQILAVNEGALANFHPGLVNSHISGSRYTPLLDRRYDPGAGAVSYHPENGFKSAHALSKGDEVFITYGEHWFRNRDYLGIIPLSEDYKKANKIVSSLAAFSTTAGSKLQNQTFASLLGLVKTDVVSDPPVKEIFKKINNFLDVANIVKSNGTAEVTSPRKTEEWLEEHGQCLDHIYTKPSTINGAGAGAFARRPISQGDVIIASPLLITYGQEVLRVHNAEERGVNPLQVAYNYHYSHSNSSLLFFPVNSAILINHQSNRKTTMFNAKEPNAELRWSLSEKKSKYVLQRQLQDLKKDRYATLVLEYVAKRDISRNEEIFIDYGIQWEEAWDKHVQSYAPPCRQKSFFGKSNEDPNCFESSAKVYGLNKDKFNPKFHSWTEDYFTVCHYDGMVPGEQSLIVLQEGDDFRGVKWDDEGFKFVATRSGVNAWIPCKVLRADEVDGIFDVVYFRKHESDPDSPYHYLRRNQRLRSELFGFHMKPYKGDAHWKGAFRHTIHFPDEMFPKQWMDLV